MGKPHIVFFFIFLQIYFGVTFESEEFCVTYNNEVKCGDGSHVTLKLIGGQKVGDVQTETIDDGQEKRNLSIKTICTKPLILEIEDFLSEEECDYLKTAAIERGMLNSVVESDHIQSMFSYRDINSDGQLSIDELRWSIQIGMNIYLENDDIQQMLEETGWDLNQDGFLTKDETKFTVGELKSQINKIVEKYPEKNTRLSYQSWLHIENGDKLFTIIQKRIANVALLPLEMIKMGEFQVVSYGVKGHYNAHHDTSVGIPYPCCTKYRQQPCRNCRFMTMMFYLNDVEGGGETAFPVANNETSDFLGTLEMSNLYKTCATANLLVKPAKGKAVIWYNHFVDDRSGWTGKVDEHTLHGGCAVTKGTKWIATQWVIATSDKLEDLDMMHEVYISNRQKSRKFKFPIKEEL